MEKEMGYQFRDRDVKGNGSDTEVEVERLSAAIRYFVAPQLELCV